MKYKTLKSLGIGGRVNPAGTVISDQRLGEMLVSMGVAERFDRDIEAVMPKIEIEPEEESEPVHDKPLKMKRPRSSYVRKRK